MELNDYMYFKYFGVNIAKLACCGSQRIHFGKIATEVHLRTKLGGEVPHPGISPEYAARNGTDRLSQRNAGFSFLLLCLWPVDRRASVSARDTLRHCVLGPMPL